MLIHYIRTALRGLVRRKLHTLISLFGLSIGLAFCLIVFGHIAFEQSFEECHAKRNQIYRVNNNYATKSEKAPSVSVMPPLGQAVSDEIPEVEHYVLVRHLEGCDLSIEQNDYKTGTLIYATQGLFEVFTLPLARGNPETALDEPFSLLITEVAAEKYFDEEDPLGKVVRLNNAFDCRITGILELIPENTQLHCEFILSYESLEA